MWFHARVVINKRQINRQYLIGNHPIWSSCSSSQFSATNCTFLGQHEERAQMMTQQKQTK